MDFDNEKFAAGEVRIRLRLYESQKGRHQLRDDLRMVVQLNGEDSRVSIRRIAYDIREIAVEGKQNTIELLGFGNDNLVRRTNGKLISEYLNLMSVLLQCPDNLAWDALIDEEPDLHTPTASKSAKSLA